MKKNEVTYLNFVKRLYKNAFIEENFEGLTKQSYQSLMDEIDNETMEWPNAGYSLHCSLRFYRDVICNKRDRIKFYMYHANIRQFKKELNRLQDSFERLLPYSLYDKELTEELSLFEAKWKKYKNWENKK